MGNFEDLENLEIQEQIGQRDSLIRSMLLTLTRASAGYIAPAELNKKINEYSETMEVLGVI